jgi:hypothetical protein
MQDDFVSICSERFPRLCVLDLDCLSRILNLVSLSDYTEIYERRRGYKRAIVNGYVYRNPKTKQLAQLTWLLASRMPQLDCVHFWEDRDFMKWDFSVERIVRDGQEVNEISLGPHWC